MHVYGPAACARSVQLASSASGCVLPFVTVRDFSDMATCYPELNGRIRPETAIEKCSLPFA